MIIANTNGDWAKMRRRVFQRTTVHLLAGLLILVTPGISAAESLAGKVGDKRSFVYLPQQGSEGNCRQAYNAYVAAAGHSAYASTITGARVLYFVCGVHVNAPSQKAAEALALKSCEVGRKKFKVDMVGGCGVVASK
ncbi:MULTISPECIES: hypothetical protein [unclassified Mesorhizobium]|uniref:hypothetical protein n=1 Tax=unclassified Mesorhizobium TaxID=325217 RepID=UPI003334C1AA